MTAPPVAQGLGSASGVAEYIALAKQLQALPQPQATGFGQAPDWQTQQKRTALIQQMTQMREQILAAQPPAPDGFHWGIQSDGSIKPTKNDSFLDSTLGPLLAFAGPALAFGASAALAPAVAGGSAAPASGTFGTAAMTGATAPSLAAPSVIGAGGLAATAPAVASGAAPVAGSTAAGIGGTGAAAVGAGAGGSVLSKLIPPAIGLGSTLIAGSEQGKANDFTQQAIDLAKQDYAGRQPFRDQALAALKAPLPQQQDRTALFANPSNPYARYAAPQMQSGPLYQKPPVTP